MLYCSCNSISASTLTMCHTDSIGILENPKSSIFQNELPKALSSIAISNILVSILFDLHQDCITSKADCDLPAFPDGSLRAYLGLPVKKNPVAHTCSANIVIASLTSGSFQRTSTCSLKVGTWYIP